MTRTSYRGVERKGGLGAVVNLSSLCGLVRPDPSACTPDGFVEGYSAETMLGRMAKPGHFRPRWCSCAAMRRVPSPG